MSTGPDVPLDPAGVLLVAGPGVDSAAETPEGAWISRPFAGWLLTDLSELGAGTTTRGQLLPGRLPPWIAIELAELDRAWQGLLDEPPPRESEIGFELAEGGEPLDATLRCLEFGRSLASAGIDLLLGPSLHKAAPGRDAVHAFGSTPELVARAAGLFIEAVQAAGVLTVPGEFPGVEGECTAAEQESEVMPFAAVFARGAEAVKVSGARVPAWDGERPASCSPKVVEEHLRGEVGFGGLVVAELPIDDVPSGSEGDPASTAIAMLDAGVDLLIVRRPSAVPGLLDGLDRAIDSTLRSGELMADRLRRALGRVVKARLDWARP